MKTIILLPAALLALFCSCSNDEKKTSAANETTPAANETTPASTDQVTAAVSEDLVQLSPEQIKNADITIGRTEEREMHQSLKVNGVVDLPPNNLISVSIPLGGYLKKTSLIPGAKVNKGSLLATLEDQQYIQLQQDYLTAKTRLQFAEADFKRQKGLNETKAASDKTFQQAQSDFSSQKIMVYSLAEKLRLLGISPEKLTENNITRSISIYSPINGFVSKVNANIGKYVSPADVIFELINPDDLHIRLTVFENDAAQLAVGQKIVCTTNSQPGVKYMATVHLITPNIGDDRSTEVHCHLLTKTKDLLPGTFINAAIELNNSKVTAVPEGAVVKWKNKQFVFTEENNHQFRLVPVETGNTNNGFTEIKSQIPSKPIVTKNAYTLLMKMKNSEEEG